MDDGRFGGGEERWGCVFSSKINVAVVLLLVVCPQQPYTAVTRCSATQCLTVADQQSTAVCAAGRPLADSTCGKFSIIKSTKICNFCFFFLYHNEISAALTQFPPQ